jgi:hypothetical protein
MPGGFVTDVVRRIVNDDPNELDEWIGTATVVSADAGTLPDGRRLISIAWRGATFTCTYNASYTPLANHKVTFIKNGPSVFVLGRPATI